MQPPAGSRVEAKTSAAGFRGVGRLGEVALVNSGDGATLAIRATTSHGDVTARSL
ncbi:hypothetical protein [Streptomyces sp. JHA26]|uniref:hypothetical protein n=1 Tax=Streptomyces sp. JHA26 TaxID=1917143 RepID=UPI0015C5709C|nr:hypothetical protein [Streptomyces sp. JHA26]